MSDRVLPTDCSRECGLEDRNTGSGGAVANLWGKEESAALFEKPVAGAEEEQEIDVADVYPFLVLSHIRQRGRKG